MSCVLFQFSLEYDLLAVSKAIHSKYIIWNRSIPGKKKDLQPWADKSLIYMVAVQGLEPRTLRI